VVGTDCRGFRLGLCEIVMFFVRAVSMVRTECRGLILYFLCDCDIYL
jgi:hypothetical protein